MQNPYICQFKFVKSAVSALFEITAPRAVAAATAPFLLSSRSLAGRGSVRLAYAQITCRITALGPGDGKHQAVVPAQRDAARAAGRVPQLDGLVDAT